MMRPNQSGKRKEVRFLPITLRQPHITAPCSAAKIHHNYTQTTTHHCTLQWSQNTPQLHSDDHISLHGAVELKYTRITLGRPHITALRTVQSTLWGILVAVQFPVRADWCSDILSKCKLMDFGSSAWCTHAPVHHAW